MAREDLHFRLRIPEDLKARIESAAEVNKRSMTAEIVSRLNDYDQLFARLMAAEAETAKLEGKVQRHDKLQLENNALRSENMNLREKVAFRDGVIESLRTNLEIVLKHLGKADHEQFDQAFAEVLAGMQSKATSVANPLSRLADALQAGDVDAALQAMPEASRSRASELLTDLQARLERKTEDAEK